MKDTFSRNKRLLLALGVLFVASTFAFIFHTSPHLLMVGTIELILIAAVVNSVVIMYSRRNWRANPYGRAFMYSKVSLAILVDLSLLIAFIGPEWEWRPALRVLLFGLILIAQARFLQLLYSLRNKEARDRYDLEETERRNANGY